MSHRTCFFYRLLACASAAVLATACSAKIQGGGASGGGSGGGGSAAGAGADSSSDSGGTAAGGAGGDALVGGSTAGTTSTTSTSDPWQFEGWMCGPPAEGEEPPSCSGLGESNCLAAKSCIPVYDDTCCSSCDPSGGCADCVQLEFHHCAPYVEACAPGGPSCGIVVPEHCACEPAPCGPVGGSPEPCGLWPGCVYTECVIGLDCDPASFCTPVRPKMCVVTCDALGFSCPMGLKNAVEDGCWGALCIAPDPCLSP